MQSGTSANVVVAAVHAETFQFCFKYHEILRQLVDSSGVGGKRGEGLDSAGVYY